MENTHQDIQSALSAKLREAQKPVRSKASFHLASALLGATTLAASAWFVFLSPNDAANAAGAQGDGGSALTQMSEVRVPNDRSHENPKSIAKLEIPIDYGIRVAAINLEIESAEKTLFEQGTTLTGSLAAARLEQLKLSKAMLDNINLASTSDVIEEVVAPRFVPDPQKAMDLEKEISKINSQIMADEQEAKKYSGGLILAMIISRIETQKLQIAQINAALLEAKFGFPMTVGSLSGSSTKNIPQPSQSGMDSEPVSVATVPWADPAFPEIDYSDRRFASLHSDGYSFFGWWAIQDTTAEIDDSRKVVALNVSEYGDSYNEDKLLVVRCVEREPAVIYLPGEYLSLDYETKQGKVNYRIDGGSTITTNWNALTDNKGVGAFGYASGSIMDALSDSKKAFIRVTEKGGQSHDAVFKMDGVSEAIGRVRDACQV